MSSYDRPTQPLFHTPPLRRPFESTEILCAPRFRFPIDPNLYLSLGARERFPSLIALDKRIKWSVEPARNLAWPRPLAPIAEALDATRRQRVEPDEDLAAAPTLTRHIVLPCAEHSIATSDLAYLPLYAPPAVSHQFGLTEIDAYALLDPVCILPHIADVEREVAPRAGGVGRLRGGRRAAIEAEDDNEGETEREGVHNSRRLSILAGVPYT